MNIGSTSKTLSTRKKTSYAFLIAGVGTSIVALLWGASLYLQRHIIAEQAQQIKSSVSPFRSIANDVAMVFERAEEKRDETTSSDDQETLSIVFNPDEPLEGIQDTTYTIRPASRDVNTDPRIQTLIKKYQENEGGEKESTISNNQDSEE